MDTSVPGSSHDPADETTHKVVNKPTHKNFSWSQKLNLHNVTLEMIHSFDEAATVTPSQYWATFVNDAWKRLIPYRSRGISAVQCQLMLTPHFAKKEWTHIFGTMAQMCPGAAESIK